MSDESNDAKDFRDTILSGYWADLKDHQERGAIIVVHQELDLVVVGIEIARDNASVVQKWIDDEKLTRPNEEQLKEWNANATKEFQFLIAQPYVLIQEQVTPSTH